MNNELHTYYVISPFEPMDDIEFAQRKEELKQSGRKVLAIVFDCKDYDDFSRKYFANI